MASPQLVELLPEQNSKLAKYSTREDDQVEHAMAASSLRMAERNSHRVSANTIDQALRRQDAMLGGSVSRMSKEPLFATSPRRHRLAAVIGFAGAGKSTCCRLHVRPGKRKGTVFMGGLAGKAAKV